MNDPFANFYDTNMREAHPEWFPEMLTHLTDHDHSGEVIHAVPVLATVDVPAGHFLYRAKDGSDHTALFVVRTIPDESTASAIQDNQQSRREDDLNAQYIIAYDNLAANGAERIRYEPLKPNPFF